MRRRGRYQGVLQILRFNRRFYGVTVAAVAAALMLAAGSPSAIRVMLLAAALPALFWMASSLVVSHYVYDRFPLYRLDWLARGLSEAPSRWLNIHAGLDETSHLLPALFPDAQGQVLDIYDPREMTEHSIGEARRSELQNVLATRALGDALPLRDDAFDAVFLMFTAHELRRGEVRLRLFRELRRVLRRGGEVALIEHSRDWANFAAFGPGFLHFFSQSTWRSVAAAAGFKIRREFSLTPFVRVFVLRRPE